ncbi:MAG: hypothetical protein ACLR1G_09690 [Alistipes indistinctus]
MKIALYSRAQASHRAGELDRLFGALAGHGFSFQVNGEFAGQVTELTGRLFAPEQLYCGPGEIDDEVRVLISYGGTALSSKRSGCSICGRFR